jgi:hypothetical protein
MKEVKKESCKTERVPGKNKRRGCNIGGLVESIWRSKSQRKKKKKKKHPSQMEANRDAAETCVTRSREAAARGFAKSCICDLM